MGKKRKWYAYQHTLTNTGELGINSNTKSRVPVAVNMGGNKIKKIAAGDSYSVALREDGQMVYTWGYNIALGTGNGEQSDSTVPIQVLMTGVLQGKTITNIAASSRTVLVLTQDGLLFSWGENSGYQLGSGDSVVYIARSPVTVNLSALPAGSKITQISLSYESGYALTNTSTVLAWGSNANGLLLQNAAFTHSDVPFVINTAIVGNISAIKAVGTTGMIISQSKQVYTFGVNDNGAMGDGKESIPVSPLGPIISTDISGPIQDAICSENGGIAITTSGVAYTWGANYEATLGFNSEVVDPPRITLHTGVLLGKEIVAVAAGYGFTLAVSTDGNMFAWGDNTYGCLGIGEDVAAKSLTPRAVANVDNTLTGHPISTVAASDRNAAAMSKTGKMFMWGDGSLGQIGDGITFGLAYAPQIVNVAGKTVVGIAITQGSSFALTSEGYVYSWGSNGNGLLADNTIDFGSQRTTPALVNTTGALNGKFVYKIFARDSAVAVITSDGQVYTWGLNQNGLLGIGTTDASIFPLPIAVDTTGALANKMIQTICIGQRNMAAVDEDGNLYAWGSGSDYANGDGDTEDRFSPVLVSMNGISSNFKVETVSCGSTSVIAVANNGTYREAYAWGTAIRKELGDVEQSPTPTRVNTIPPSHTMKVSMSLVGVHAVVLTRNFTEPPPSKIPFVSKIFVMGNNEQGTVGDGTAYVTPIPVQLVGTALAGKIIKYVTTGASSTYVIDTNDQIFAWVRITLKMLTQ